MTRPFDTARQYRDRGWLGTLPLPIGKKAEPPAGYTGAGGGWPTEATVFGWMKNGQSNIALRLPEEVVGIDVDDYGDKHGGETLATLEGKWGRLPATWISTSRNLPSGIRLFRVPAGVEATLGDPGPDIEIIKFSWRYLVAAPSLHPDMRRYGWIRPDGQVADDGELPSPDELERLPDLWLEGLRGSGSKPGPRADRRERSKQARAWLAALPGGEPCRYVGTVAADLYATAARGEGSAHDVSLADLLALLRAGETGHPGVYGVLERAKGIFVKTVRADRGGDEVARAEFDRMVDGGVLKIIAEPGERAGLGCDCPVTEPSGAAGATRIVSIDTPTAPTSRRSSRGAAGRSPTAVA